jgi:carboxypeptidase D
MVKTNFIVCLGGPGTSSLLGLFATGPVTMHQGGKFEENPHGLHTTANVLYMEAPAGVWFSTSPSSSKPVKSIEEIKEQFWNFVQSFQRVFPHTRNFKWFLSGESYGGMLVPHFAQMVHERSKKADDKDARPFKISGITIGNGLLMSPHDFPSSWVSYFETKGLLTNETQYTELRTLSAACTDEVKDRKKFKQKIHPQCDTLTKKFMNKDYMMDATRGKHCVPSMYDVRLTKCNENDPTDALVVHLEKYLNRSDVRKALHVPEAAPDWKYVSKETYQNLYFNGDEPSYNLLPQLAAQDLPILIFAGDQDIICNYVGIKKALDFMTWNSEQGFGSKTLQDMKFDGKALGRVAEARGVSYMQVYNASHMVGMSQPEGALHIMKTFLSKGKLL